MAERSGGDVRLRFGVDRLDLDLHVLGLRGEEAISGLFELTLDLACDVGALQALVRREGPLFRLVVGHDAVLRIARDTGESRHVHGMVCRFEQRESARRFAVFSATLVPHAWALLHRTDCRIFQGLPATAIVADEVLGPGRVRCRLSCKGNQPPATREYCVQYRESDWDFAARLLEEEGYFFFFEHAPSGHLMHIANHARAHPPIPGSAALPLRPPGDAAPAEEHVLGLCYAEHVTAGRVALGDHNPLTPSLPLAARAAPEQARPDGSAGLEVFDFPGRHATPEEGSERARVRWEALDARRRLATGRSDCVRLIPGHTFELAGDAAEHPDLAHLLGQRFLVTRVVHTAEKDHDLEAGAVSDRSRYSNTFECIPAAVPFRPARRTARPVVPGAQTAVVVGPKDQEIYTDQHGRVKVRFRWDRRGKSDEHSSCWVRVGQPWAGQRWGAMFIPRVGNEVIVAFLEGDPDRPIVTGSVHHPQNPPPLDLPQDATRTTIKTSSSPGGGGSNELRFEDKKGAEEVYLHAQRNLTEVVEASRSTSVGASRSETVGQNATTTVQRGNRKVAVSEGKSELTAKKEIKVHSQAAAVRVMGQEVHVRGSGGEKGVSVTGEPRVFATSSQEVKLEVGQASVTLSPAGGVVLMDGEQTGVRADADMGVTAQSPNAVQLAVDGATITIDTAGIRIHAGGKPLEVSGGEITITGGTVKVAGGEIDLN